MSCFTARHIHPLACRTMITATALLCPWTLAQQSPPASESRGAEDLRLAIVNLTKPRDAYIPELGAPVAGVWK